MDAAQNYFAQFDEKPEGLDSQLDLVGQLENSGDEAVSPKGAIGRYQIMPDTARQYGFDPVKLWNPDYNRNVARTILSDLNARFPGDRDAVLTAYNAGPGRAKDQYSKLPKETQKYLARAAELTKYDTPLSPFEEEVFQEWKKQNAPNDSGEDYDLRGAFKAQVTQDPDGHWPDTFKKPNHPTFSVESKYAQYRPELAGSWSGPNHDQYVPPKNFFAQYDENAPEPGPPENYFSQFDAATDGKPPVKGKGSLLFPGVAELTRGLMGTPNELPDPSKPSETLLGALPKQLRTAADVTAQSILGPLQWALESPLTPNMPMGSAELEAMEPDFMKQARETQRKTGPLQKLSETIQQDMDENVANVRPFSASGITGQVLASAPAMIAAAVTGLATKSPLTGALVVGAATFGQEYSQERAQGQTPEWADLGAAVNGFSESLGEEIPLGIIMSPGGKFLSKTLKAAGAEGIQEALTQIIQTGYDKGVLSPDMTWGEAWAQVAQAGIVGAVMGGGLAGITHPFTKNQQEAEQPPGEEEAPPVGETFQEPEQDYYPGKEEPPPPPPRPPVSPTGEKVDEAPKTDVPAGFKSPTEQTETGVRGLDLETLVQATQDYDEAQKALPKGQRILDEIKLRGGVKLLGPDGYATKEGQDFYELIKDDKRLNRTVKRGGIINNYTGVPPDQLRGALQEDGWFGRNPEDGADISALYDAVNQDTRSKTTLERFYHPESDISERIKGRHNLDQEMDDAGISSNDPRNIAIAKLAHARFNRDLLNSTKQRADALGIKYPSEATYEEVLHAIVTHEANQRAQQDIFNIPDEHGRLNDIEDGIDAYVEANKAAYFDDILARFGATPKSGQVGVVPELPEDQDHPARRPFDLGETDAGTGAGGEGAQPGVSANAVSQEPAQRPVKVPVSERSPAQLTDEELESEADRVAKEVEKVPLKNRKGERYTGLRDRMLNLLQEEDNRAEKRAVAAGEKNAAPRFQKAGKKKVGLGFNAERAVAVFGPKMYGTDLAQTVVKELLQNSFDGIKSAYNRGDLQRGSGEVTITVNGDTKTITFEDNGSGMTPEIVEKAFLTLAGTDKSDLSTEERSGGLGLAKLQFIFGNDGLELTTVRDGIVTSLKTNGKELLANKALMETRAATANENRGTVVRVKIPTETSDGKEVHLPGFHSGYDLFQKPLLGDMGVTFRHAYNSFTGKETIAGEDTLKIGRNQDLSKTPLVTTAHFPWGSMDVYMGRFDEKNSTGQWRPEHYVLSSGIYQFDMGITKHRDSYDRIPYNLILNVKPSVDAANINYPINNQREGWSPRIDNDIAQLVGFLRRKSLSEEARKLGGNLTESQQMPRVNGPIREAKVTIEPRLNGRMWAVKNASGVTEDVFPTQEEAQKAATQLSQERDDQVEYSKFDFTPHMPQELKGPTFQIEPDIYIKGGKTKVKGKSVDVTQGLEEDSLDLKKFRFPDNVIPTDEPYLHNNLNVDPIALVAQRLGNQGITEADVRHYFAAIGTVVKKFAAALADVSDLGPFDLESYKMWREAGHPVGLSLAKAYHGVHFQVPFHAFFLNPISTRDIINESPAIARDWMHTLLHEATHTIASGHTESFTTALAGLEGAFEQRHPRLRMQLETDLEEIVDKNRAIFDALRDIYNDAATADVVTDQPGIKGKSRKEPERPGRVPGGTSGPRGIERVAEGVHPGDRTAAETGGVRDESQGIAQKPWQKIARGLEGRELTEQEASDPEVRKLFKIVRTAFNQLIPEHLAGVGFASNLRATETPSDEVFGAAFERLTPEGIRHIAALSLKSPKLLGSARHEAVHVLKKLGFFKPHEWTSLERAATDGGWLEKYDIKTRYPELSLKEMIEEAIAERFSEWFDKRNLWVPKAIRPLFNRLAKLLMRVRGAIREAFGGKLTADDVMARIDAGLIGRRGAGAKQAPVPAPAAALSYTATPGKITQEHDDEVRRLETEAMRKASGTKYQKGPTTEPSSTPPPKGDLPARTNLLWEFIAKGQPIDRAMSIPFNLFGGLTAGRVWNPSKFITKSANQVIRQARFSKDGSFAFMNPMLYKARAMWLDKFQLSEEYVLRSQETKLDKQRYARKGLTAVQSMEGLTDAEAVVLNGMLNDEEIGTADLEKLAAPIRSAITDIGAEFVHVGLISRESYERNKGKYLHRVYLKHEGDFGGAQRFANKFFASRRRRFIADEMKGRGHFMNVPKTTLVKNLPGFFSGERGEPVKGERLRMLDKFKETAGIPGIGAPEPKPIRRVFVPADKPIPAEFSDYTDRGEYEVRNAGTKNYTLWRDWTKAERTKWGEIVDARYTVAKTFSLMANDLATGKFYKDISTNAEWARTEAMKPNTKTVDAGDWKRFLNDPNVEWVKVPDSSIPKTGGVKRWGALAGMYVRAEIWRDLNERNIMDQENFWQTLLRGWKIGKTALSPVTHMNNIVSNFVLMDLADVRTQDLVSGIKDYVQGGKAYEEAREAGVFGADMVTQDLRREVFNPILKKLEAAARGTGPKSKFDALTAVANAIWKPAKFITGKAMDLYLLEDEVFRMATYTRERAFGHDSKTAARIAREQFIDYDISAPLVNALSRSVIPFLRYQYRAAPLIAKSIAQRPWKLPKYFLLATMAGALAYMLSPGDEDEERRSLRDDQQGYSWVGVPRMMRMPYRDQWGNPVFMDTRRWVPGGDIFDITQNNSAIPIPAPLQFGGPFMSGMELIFNRSAFTGDPLVNTDTDTPWEQTAKLGDWAWKSMAPNAAIIPGTWYWDRIMNAAKGATDIRGTPYSVPSALASSVGVKVQGQDVDLGFSYLELEFKKHELEIRDQARKLGRDYERGIISKSSYDEGLISLQDKLTRAGEELQARELGPKAEQAIRDAQTGRINPAARDRILDEAKSRADARKDERLKRYEDIKRRKELLQQGTAP